MNEMKTNVKLASKSFGDPYECLKNWPEDCGVQCGGHGIVLPANSIEKVFTSDKPLTELATAATKKESYTTAFFEAFPKEPSCFIRGEGKTIEEAEEKAFNKFQKILECPGHEFEPRGRKDGYGYCKHCNLSMSGVLPILNKCCKCKIPTNWTTDDKGKYYCRKHGRTRPKSKEKGSLFNFDRERKISRRRKKFAKKVFRMMIFELHNVKVKTIRMKGRYHPILKADKWEFDMIFGRKRMYKFIGTKRKKQ